MKEGGDEESKTEEREKGTWKQSESEEELGRERE